METNENSDTTLFKDISTAKLEFRYKTACDYIQYLEEEAEEEPLKEEKLTMARSVRDEVARELLSRSTTPMTEIKRYKNAYGGNYDEMAQDPQGKWVRWEDVEDLLMLKPTNR